MRSRLLLGGLAAGLAFTLAPQAQATAAPEINCHHYPQLCEMIEDAQPSINCHHIQWVCELLEK